MGSFYFAGQQHDNDKQVSGIPPDSSNVNTMSAEKFGNNLQFHRRKYFWRLVAAAIALVIVAVLVTAIVVVVKKQSNTASSHTLSAYANLTRIRTLDENAFNNSQRVFAVGDIHGCLQEFNTLLSNINYNASTDKMILLGDMVAKGPDSQGVIRRAKELGALCVRGNHDDKVVRFKTYYLEKGEPEVTDGVTVLPEGPVPDPLQWNDFHGSIAKNLTREDYDYLVNCPLILSIPSIHSLFVHAGLDPAKTLDNQNPYSVMNMRTMDANGMPLKAKSGEPWTDVWNRRNHEEHVYYGHEASKGLQLKQYTSGLDTGCVYGRKLTAMEIHTGALTQVQCQVHAAR